MRALLLLLLVVAAAWGQAKPVVRVWEYAGTPTAGDCTSARLGNIAVDTSTSPDTVYRCRESGGSTVWVLVEKFTVPFSFGTGGTGLSPADATTYYFGLTSALGGTTTEGHRKLYIAVSGKFTVCYGNMIQSGSGSNETSTISIRVNGTTDYTVSSSIANDGGLPGNAFSGTANAPVTAGQYVEIKWVTPTWATNPTGVFFGGTCAFQPD